MDTLVCVIALVLVFLGIVFSVGDFRHFSDIEKQCQSQGFIQNDKVRIICSKEVK